MTNKEIKKICDGYAKVDPLRAAVAYRYYNDDAEMISMVTGVSLETITNYVTTGEIDHATRIILQTAAQ